MATDYMEKEFLDKEGLKKVFELIREEYSSKDDVNENIIAMDVETIESIYCSSCGCEEEVELPNNEIWYKTSDNKPIYLGIWVGPGYSLKKTINSLDEVISNEYDPEDDCCKIKFNKDIIMIPNDLIYNQPTLCEIIHLPSTIESIGSSFLNGCSGLQSLDLSGLNNVKSIGSDFLYQCTSLTSLDFSSLNNVESIGDAFLRNCSGLQAIDLLPLSNVESIGNNFLSYCSDLKSFDLSPLSKVTSIGDYFLCECYNLSSLDLSPLSKVTNIGGGFLSRCSGLTSLDLSPLSKVTNIESAFLASCKGLQTIDLSPLSKVTSIDEEFLENCSGLQSLNLSSLSGVTSIGDYFLSGCLGLTSIDLSPLSNVTWIGMLFLSNCSNLKTFIIDHPEGLITLPLEKSYITPDEIYVNDELLTQYQQAVSKWSSKFKPLSEYQGLK